MPPKKKATAAVAPPSEEDVSMTDAAAPEVQAEADIPDEISLIGQQRDENNPATPPESEQRIRIVSSTKRRESIFGTNMF
jgi:hypothetical protein